jgi:hypothetical protein
MVGIHDEESDPVRPLHDLGLCLGLGEVELLHEDAVEQVPGSAVVVALPGQHVRGGKRPFGGGVLGGADQHGLTGWGAVPGAALFQFGLPLSPGGVYGRDTCRGGA